MTLIASAAALLHAAIQDVGAGKRDAAARLPAIAERASDPALAVLLRAEAARAGAQAARLAASADLRGPKNLWMTGILDDAERDARSTEPGRLLDIALVGAIRKAKAAEIVSSETAIALAAQLGDTALEKTVSANRDEEIAADRALKDVLARLTA